MEIMRKGEYSLFDCFVNAFKKIIIQILKFVNNLAFFLTNQEVRPIHQMNCYPT